MSDLTEIPIPTPADVTLRGNSRSSSIGALAGALALAQGAVKNPLRERKVKIKTKQGYEYSFFYADLAACLEVARPVLSANGLAIVQTCSVQGRDAVVVTELMHTSGEWIRSELAFRAADDIKELAGVFTYLRRYAISPIIGIAPEDDDQVEQSQSQAEPTKKAATGDYKHISVSEPKPTGNGSKKATEKAAEPASTSADAKGSDAPSAAPVEASEHDGMVKKAASIFPASKVVNDTAKDSPSSDDTKNLLWEMAREVWAEDTKNCLNGSLKNSGKKPVEFKTLTDSQAKIVHEHLKELLDLQVDEVPF